MDPDTLAGSPFVVGTRIPVRRLWAWHRSGITVDTLLRRYPQLGPARVLSALAFAYDNTELIEEDLAREKELLANEPPPSSMSQLPLLEGAPPAPPTKRRR